MARLPGDRYIINTVGDNSVVLWEVGTEREIASFDPTNANDVALTQEIIYKSELNDEEKCFAHFWSGYFYAHFGGH